MTFWYKDKTAIAFAAIILASVALAGCSHKTESASAPQGPPPTLQLSPRQSAAMRTVQSQEAARRDALAARMGQKLH